MLQESFASTKSGLDTNTSPRLFHYTYGLKWPQIEADGVIKLATAHIPTLEKPVVWFSSNEIWESTVNAKTIEHDGSLVWRSMEETHKNCGGLVRIAVALETAVVTWKIFKQKSGITSGSAKFMLHGARETGAKTSEWRCSWVPVPRSLWLAVEVWDGQRWGVYRATVSAEGQLFGEKSPQRGASTIRPPWV